MQKRFAFTISVLVVALFLVSSAPVNAQKNLKFYLHDGELLDDTEPSKLNDSVMDLREKGIWKTAAFPYGITIMGDIDVFLWLQKSEAPYPWTRVRTPKVSLYDISPDGTKTEIGRLRKLVTFTQQNTSSTDFSITVETYLLDSKHSLQLEVNSLLSTGLLYGSSAHRSYVSVPYQTPGDIELVSTTNQQSVPPQGNTTYSITVKNMGSQQDTVKLSHDYQGTAWHVYIDPTSVTIPSGSLEYVELHVEAVDASIGDTLTITVTGVGQSDSGSVETTTRVREPLYGVDVSPPIGQAAGPGERIIYNFTIKNTGEVDETYNLSHSVNPDDWRVTLKADENLFLLAGESTTVAVEVKVPGDAENQSTASVTLRAESSKAVDSATVTTRVFFEPSEEVENWTPYLILIILAFILLYVIKYLAERGFMRWIKLMCMDRLLEVAPGGMAEFLITVMNPLKRKKGNAFTYHFDIKGDIPKQWETTLDHDTVHLEGQDATDVTLRVHPPKDAPLDEWASVEVSAAAEGKSWKSENLRVIVLLKEPKADVKIRDVTYKPPTFNKGDKVILSAQVYNEGSGPAEGITIKLFVNDEEQNRIENVTIPAHGYASIEIPWIAAPDENRIHIKIE